MVIGRAVTGVLLCASGLAIYNEGVVPFDSKKTYAEAVAE